MRCLVTGGSASGKSEYAENLAAELSRGVSLYYIATMEPYGEEAGKRIRRHRRLREAKGFQTIECYRNIHQAFELHPDAAGTVSYTHLAGALIHCVPVLPHRAQDSLRSISVHRYPLRGLNP